MPSSWLSTHSMTKNTAALTSIPVSTVATAAGTRWRPRASRPGSRSAPSCRRRFRAGCWRAGSRGWPAGAAPRRRASSATASQGRGVRRSAPGRAACQAGDRGGLRLRAVLRARLQAPVMYEPPDTEVTWSAVSQPVRAVALQRLQRAERDRGRPDRRHRERQAEACSPSLGSLLRRRCFAPAVARQPRGAPSRDRTAEQPGEHAAHAAYAATSSEGQPRAPRS